MTKIWLVNWHFQSRITLWCRHKSTNVSMGLCWQMSKFIVWHLWSIYFDHHLVLKLSIGKRRKQSCTPNTFHLNYYWNPLSETLWGFSYLHWWLLCIFRTLTLVNIASCIHKIFDWKLLSRIVRTYYSQKRIFLVYR